MCTKSVSGVKKQNKKTIGLCGLILLELIKCANTCFD